ncbi:hypothetical protein SS209_03570 [Salmonella enterica subsp. enterica serovar Senftenberg str. SS209]|nr:hypothetical protein SS209_03570 [Salmonella enterica subsp. enterica serovar Senftenberg str. SS209]
MLMLQLILKKLDTVLSTGNRPREK